MNQELKPSILTEDKLEIKGHSVPKCVGQTIDVGLLPPRVIQVTAPSPAIRETQSAEEQTTETENNTLQIQRLIERNPHWDWARFCRRKSLLWDYVIEKVLR